MGIWQYYVPAKRRQFGKYMYEFDKAFYSKEDANRYAKELRKNGYLARVVKKGEDWYLVYKRKKE